MIPRDLGGDRGQRRHDEALGVGLTGNLLRTTRQGDDRVVIAGIERQGGCLEQDLEGQRRTLAERRRLLQRGDPVLEPAVSPLDGSADKQQSRALSSIRERQRAADQGTGAIRLSRHIRGFGCEDETRCARGLAVAQLRRALKRARRRGVTPALLRSPPRCLQSRGNRRIGSQRRPRLVPHGTVCMLLGSQRVRQRGVSPLALRQGR